MPTVTILTPTYQRRQMLRLTLASVRLQTGSDVEHIVVDGGSTDGTLELLQRAETQWGVRWVSERDGGMYEAINKGLGMAHGSIVSWVNSDDWLLPWSTETAVAHMLATDVPTAVYGDVVSVEAGSVISAAQLYGAFDRDTLATVGTLAQPTVFWPMWASREVGLLDTKTYRQIADCDYWLRLSKIVQFRKVRELMAVVVNHHDTKRASLARDIADEFELLRAAYRPDGARPRWDRIKFGLAWRRELGRLVMGRDWPATRGSALIVFPGSSLSRSATLLRFGPHRRHPLLRLDIDIAEYVKQLERTAHELEC